MVMMAVMMFSSVCAMADSAECKVIRSRMRSLASACLEENELHAFKKGPSTYCFNIEENSFARDLFAR